MMRRTVKPGKKRCERRGASRIDTPPVGLEVSSNTRGISTIGAVAVPQAVPLASDFGDEGLSELVSLWPSLSESVRSRLLRIARDKI